MRNEQQAKRNEQSATGKKVTSQEPGARSHEKKVQPPRRKTKRCSENIPTKSISIHVTDFY